MPGEEAIRKICEYGSARIKVDGIGSSSGYKEEGYGNDPEASLNTVENPVPDNPVKKETDPYTGTGALGGGDVEYSRNGHGKHRTCRG